MHVHVLCTTADMIKTKTEGDREYDRYWQTVLGRERFVVQIKACKKALIILASSPYVFEDAVEINMAKDGDVSTDIPLFLQVIIHVPIISRS